MRRLDVETATLWAQNRVDELISRVSFYGGTSDELQAGVVDIVRGMASGEIVPTWSRAFVAGYYRALLNRLYQSDLFFAHVDPDGTLWTPQEFLGKPRVGAAAGPGIKNSESLYGRDLPENLAGWKTWPTGHFWKAREDNPARLGKPFFVGEGRSYPFPGLIHGDITPLPRRTAA